MGFEECIAKMQAVKEEDTWKMQRGDQINCCDDKNRNAFGVSAPVVSGDDSAATEKIVGQSNYAKLSSSDDFYEKLTRFYDKSGLSLIFNFRETKVDLYLFYKDVTERGGYYQVTKDGRWDEVAYSLNAESGALIPPNQIQMLYANLFYPFEQTYYYRTRSNAKEAQRLKAALTGHSFCSGKSSGSLTKKRKHSESNDDGLLGKRVSLQSSFQLPTGLKSVVKNAPLQTPSAKTNLVLKIPTKAKETQKSSIKEMKKHSNAPMRFRTAYIIFLMMECERLKTIHGKGSAVHYRDMANDAWKRLSESDRQPYIEASKRDKERYTREMAEFKIVYDKIAETQSVAASTKLNTVINFAKPSLQNEGDYGATLPNVTVPSDASDNVVTDEDLAAEIMQKPASSYPTFQLNWGGYT